MKIFNGVKVSIIKEPKLLFEQSQYILFIKSLKRSKWMGFYGIRGSLKD
jgi:hypothetical protein